VDTLQVSLFFLISYLISRVFVIFKIPELILFYLLEKKRISIPKLTLILIVGTTLLSSVIANIIAVLTLMPLVLLLQNGVNSTGKNKLKLNTLFLLCVIWGANIGGIGMVTGTTTNGILIGLYEGFKVPIGKDFTFFTWMTWGIPLALILSIVGWLILMLLFQPGKMIDTSNFRSKLTSFTMTRKLQKIGFILAAVFIITASLLSLSLNLFDKHKLWVIGITVLWTLVFLYLLFLHYWKTEDNAKQRLLLFKDTLQDLPKKGLLWVAIGVLVTLIFWFFKLHNLGGLWLVNLFKGNQSHLMLFVSLALISTFASEIFSNSGVQITMFMVLFPLLKHNPGFSWEGMLIVSLCSTCAFMSPIGTPSNGLGYGSSQKISLKYMLGAGLIMNIASSMIISFWVPFIVPTIINIFS